MDGYASRMIDFGAKDTTFAVMAGSQRNAFVSLLLYACASLLFAPTTRATPSIALPFNAQVPTVARVGSPYNFQFSASTFAPASPATDTSNFTYALSDYPPWLLLDSATRTLSGSPSSADEGSATFTLIATDAVDGGTASLECTIVVSSDPPPVLEGDVGSMLAATANLSSPAPGTASTTATPPTVTLLPLRSFSFQFQQASFIDIVRRRLYYYATLTDHTPLPSWLLFDASTLTFSGLAPELSAFPQSWTIELIASDVEGFGGASARFEIAVRDRHLGFAPNQQVVNVTAGADVEFDGLGDTLFLNGARVPEGAVADAQVEGKPQWLDFDKRTLVMSGRAPEDVENANVTVTVRDAFGNRAIAVVILKVEKERDESALFVGNIGPLNAEAGKAFEYHFSDDLFASEGVELQVLLPATAKWLKFDSRTRTLSGKVPEQTSDSTIKATITAKAANSDEADTQEFSIQIQGSAPPVSSTSSVLSTMSTSSSATSTPELAGQNEEGPQRYTPGAVAGITVGAVAAVAILAALLFLCCRRRKRQNGYVDSDHPSRRTISRPILPPEHDAIMVTKEVETDVERNAGRELPGIEEKPEEPPPQIALDLPTQPTSRRMKWSKRFSRISQVSSIGNGEEAIRADNNIPEWGRDSNALHTPHDSFYVPAEIARSSRQLSADLSPSKMSPSKRALKRLRQNRQSQQSIGLGIDTGGAVLLPRHSSRGAPGHQRATSSIGMSTVIDGSSLASVSTRGTSLLSGRASASDFPRPGTRSTFGSRSIPGLTASEKRRSIRLVDRSDSVADNRSMHEKRQSFIRNRASTSLASPLFAHGSRASSNPLQNGQSSRDASSAGSQRRSRRGKSQLTTYSESSSLEPQASETRRLSQRVRSAFAPSFPRAITKSSLGADDEEDTSDFETVSTSNSEAEWRAEMALPRHERSWVLPNEASPTPPPGPPTSRQPSSSRKITPSSRDSEARQKWKSRFRDREHSSSPLSTAVAVPIAPDRSTSTKAQQKRNRLSEPIDLVSSDSLSKGKLERPRLVQTNSKRPVSVEKVQRLSSLKAETDDARPGSEVWEAMEGAGLMPPNSRDGKDSGSRRSDMSGPAFI